MRCCKRKFVVAVDIVAHKLSIFSIKGVVVGGVEVGGSINDEFIFFRLVYGVSFGNCTLHQYSRKGIME
jgi:hypothetical protein